MDVAIGFLIVLSFVLLTYAIVWLIIKALLWVWPGIKEW